MIDTMWERLDQEPFKEMEELDDGLYSMFIGADCTASEVKETESSCSDMVFGSAYEVMPSQHGYNVDWQLQAGFEMLLYQHGMDIPETAMRLDGEASFFDIGLDLQDLGFHVEWLQAEDFWTIIDLLDDGPVFCAVNDLVLQLPAWADLPGLGADRLVAVTGIDLTNPANPRVYIDDPCADNRQRDCHLAAFVCAWKSGDNAILTAEREKR